MKQVKLRASLRDYQREALEWSLARDSAVIVMPTGSGKTVIAAAWIAEMLSRGSCRRILVLEPTRILVEQTARRLAHLLEGVKVNAAYGLTPRKRRLQAYTSSDVIVATPESAWEDREAVENNVDCVVVDECHHTVGFDASAKLLRSTHFKHRLGLTAYLPDTRRSEVERLIGEVRVWSWRDPRIRPYVPPWIGEVYEAPLNRCEQKLLLQLERLAEKLHGVDKALVRMAERWLVRDGALALRDSLERDTRLSRILAELRDYILDPCVRPAHKLPALQRALLDHGFPKTIVFVDRVRVAEYIADKLSQELHTVLIVGRHRVDMRKALEEAWRRETRLIVSTSAGEEGVDLPDAKMLVVWSIVASPLRFIQRHGRVRRATGSREPRWVVYIVTPETIDMDSFVESLEYALKAGVDLPVSPETLEELRRRTLASKILSILSQEPMLAEWVSEVTGFSRDLVERELRRLCRRGEVYYIHSPFGRIWFTLESIVKLEEKYPELLEANVECNAKATSRSLKRGVRGANWRQLFDTLRSRLPLDGLTLTLEAPLPGGAYLLRRVSYTCRISEAAVLEVVLRNAFSSAVVYQPSGKSSHHQLGVGSSH